MLTSKFTTSRCQFPGSCRERIKLAISQNTCNTEYQEHGSLNKRILEQHGSLNSMLKHMLVLIVRKAISGKKFTSKNSWSDTVKCACVIVELLKQWPSKIIRFGQAGPCTPFNYRVTIRCSKKVESNIKMYIKVTVTMQQENWYLYYPCSSYLVVALVTKTETSCIKEKEC